ncbi:MAG: phage tail assembly protein [Synergistaceae bacterium]|nr:phage tail assembly protein [Synergistaceae bacterium]
MKIELKKAVTLGGKSVKEINLELEKLTGSDLIDAEKEVMISDNTPLVMDFNRSFLITIAAKSAGMAVDALKSLNIRDFSKITGEVQRFLLGSGSSETDEAEIQATAHETSLEE